MLWVHLIRRPTPFVVLLLALGVTGVQALAADTPQASLEAALEALRDGDAVVARERLEAVVERWPGYRKAHYHLGRLAFERGDLAEAERHLEAGAEGDFPGAYSAAYYLGRTRLLQRDFGAAIDALDRALEQAPEFGPALLERGRARIFLGEPHSGLDDLRAALSTAASPGRAAVLAGQLLIALDRPAEAMPLIGELAGRSDREELWSRQAEWLQLAAQGGPEALSKLGSAVEEAADSGDLYWALAATYRSSDPQRSALLFRLALDHDSENPVSVMALRRLYLEDRSVELPDALPHLSLALARVRRLWDEERFEEARQVAERLLEQRPTLVPPRLLLAAEAELRGDLWQAAWIYQRLLEWLGPIPAIARDLAEVAQTMGAEDLAVCAVESALMQAAEDGSLYYLLGGIEADRGQTDAAIEAYERALDLGYEDVRTWLRLGELYFEKMSISESIEAYQKAMQLDPGAAEAVRAFALSSLTTEQYESLRSLLQAHIREHPDNINTLYSLAVMSLRDNRLDEAKEYLLRLAEIAPDHRQVHYNLGQILLRQGEVEAGQAEMERFRQIKAAEDQEWEIHNHAHFRRVEARKRMESGQPEEAVALYEQSVREGTAELSDYVELAAANVAAGRWAEALEGYQGVLESYPYHRPAIAGLKAAAASSGQREIEEWADRLLRILDWPCNMSASEPAGGRQNESSP